jgi:alditol oxidase
MDKRNFLKRSGAFLAGSMLSPLAAAGEEHEPRKNWAGNYQYSTDHLHLPNSVEQVQQIVKSCSKLKALGTRHSFNGIADSTANQISVLNLKHMALDPKSRTVTVDAGVKYGELAP